MTYEDMLGHVAVGAGLEKDEADRVTRAFFRTLAKRIGNDEASELAAQLPLELQDTLAPTDPDVEEFSAEEFLDHMATDAGIEAARAEQAVHAIWQTLTSVVTGGELGEVESQLSRELVDVFNASGAA